MEFLKELFGTEALTYGQLAEKVTAKKMKLADLSTGAYVGKEKFDALTVEKEGLSTRLAEANAKLEGYDPEWKAKAAQAQKDADARVAAVQRDAVIDGAIAKAKARNAKAVRALLDMDTLAKSTDLSKDVDAALAKVAKENDYLFEGNAAKPEIKGAVPADPGPKETAAVSAGPVVI